MTKTQKIPGFWNAISFTCSVFALVSLAFTTATYASWVLSAPFVNDDTEKAINDVGNKALLATLPVLLVKAVTVFMTIDQRYDAIGNDDDDDGDDDDDTRLTPSEPQDQQFPERHSSNCYPCGDTIVAASVQNQLPLIHVNESINLENPTNCQYLNQPNSQHYLRCTVHPTRTDCIDCKDFQPR